MAATDPARGGSMLRRLLGIVRRCGQAGARKRPADAARLAGLVGGVLAAASADSAELPEDRAESMYHLYDGGVGRVVGFLAP